MNAWLIAGLLVLLATVPCAVVMARGKTMKRLVALQGTQVLIVLALLMLAEGFGRDFYIDAALVLAILSLAGGLVFVRFLERWI